jgi:hypothetical protein
LLRLTTWLLINIVLDSSNFGTSFYLSIVEKCVIYAIMLCKDISYNRAFFCLILQIVLLSFFFVDSSYPCRQWNLEGSLQENTSFVMF